MADYLYDGTFFGFLCCVHGHYYIEKATSISANREYQNQLLSKTIDIETDEEKALIVYNAIEKKISPFDLARVYRVFLSEVDKKEMKLLNYIRLGFVKGGQVSNLHGNPIVFEVQSAEKKVTFEVHRLAGLIRFSILEGNVLYGQVEPDHDILELLAPHFTDRYSRDTFMIHDLKRKKALIYNEGEWCISQITTAELPSYAKEEVDYRRLWKEYFETIAIKERTNSRCQKNFMPVRYWKHLTELQENY